MNRELSLAVFPIFNVLLVCYEQSSVTVISLQMMRKNPLVTAAGDSDLRLSLIVTMARCMPSSVIDLNISSESSGSLIAVLRDSIRASCIARERRQFGEWNQR